MSSKEISIKKEPLLIKVKVLFYYGMQISEIVPETSMSVSMSFFLIVSNTAIFLAPYVPVIIQNIFSIEGYANSFFYIGLILIIGSVLSAIFRLKRNQGAN